MNFNLKPDANVTKLLKSFKINLLGAVNASTNIKIFMQTPLLIFPLTVDFQTFRKSF